MQTTDLAKKNNRPELTSTPAAAENKNISSQNTLNNYSNSNERKIEQKQNPVVMKDSAKQYETAIVKQQEKDKMVVADNTSKDQNSETSTSAKKDIQTVSIVTPVQDSTITDSTLNANLNKTAGNKITAGNNGKHKKKKSKNILISHLNYNGL